MAAQHRNEAQKQKQKANNTLQNIDSTVHPVSKPDQPSVMKTGGVFFRWSFENRTIQFKICFPESFCGDCRRGGAGRGARDESCRGTAQGNEAGVRRRLRLTWDDNACPSVQTVEVLVNILVQRIGPVVPGGVLPRGLRQQMVSNACASHMGSSK